MGEQPKRKWVTPLREHPVPVSPRFLDIRDDTHNLLAHIPTLLVVDDDPESLYVYKQFLCRIGYQVIFAINGEQVIEKARQFKPVAIILDLMLPQKSGWEVLEELRVTDDLKDIPVIIASVLDHRERGVCAGAFRYLTKPMSENQLAGVLEELEKDRKKDVRRVLVIDDDPVEIGIAKTLFTKAGLDVVAMQEGAEAVEWAAAHKPDFIVLDLMMPGTDGFDVLSMLKDNSETAPIPVLVYTAKDVTEEEKAKILSKARRIFPKVPLQIEEMLDELQKALQTIPGSAEAQQLARETTVVDESERLVRPTAGGGLAVVEEGAPRSPAPSNSPGGQDHGGDPVLTADTEPVRQQPVRPVAEAARATSREVVTTPAPAESNGPPVVAPPQGTQDGTEKETFRARILLVEDDPANQYSLGFLLRSRGYEVLQAENGEEGIQLADIHRPDLILMDMMMPVMSGFEATRYLKRTPELREIPVIALTAAAMRGDRERTLAAGCDDYVSKPVDRQVLLDRIEQWIAKASTYEPVGELS